jgi:cupin domain
VLEGEFEFSVGDDTVAAGVGSLIYVPKGTLHAFKNLGEGSGRLLNSQTSGGLLVIDLVFHLPLEVAGVALALSFISLMKSRMGEERISTQQRADAEASPVVMER